jgi:hypothetical protein
MDPVLAIDDDFVNSPISALRFIALPLRRTASTPRDTRFARLHHDGRSHIFQCEKSLFWENHSIFPKLHPIRYVEFPHLPPFTDGKGWLQCLETGKKGKSEFHRERALALLP